MPFAGFVLPALILRPGLETALGLVHINMGPISVTLGFVFNILMVAIAAALAGYALLVDRRYQAPLVTIALIWAPFLLAGVLAAVRSPEPAAAIQVLFNYFTYAAVAFIALLYSPALSRERLTMVIWSSGFLPLAIGFVQVATGTAGPRLMGSFSHPNILAFFLFVYIAFLFHALLAGYVRERRLVLAIWGTLGLAGIALLLTGTRSAYVAVYAYVFLYSAFRKPILILPLILLPFAALLVPGVMDRLSDVSGGGPDVSYDYLVAVGRGDVAGSTAIGLDSATWRKFLWESSLPWIRRNLLLGYGLASFPHYISEFFPLREERGAAHNIYIQMMFEGGLFLTLGYISILITVMVRAMRHVRQLPAEAAFTVLTVIMFAVASFSDNMLYYLSVNIEFWLVIFAMYPMAQPNVRRHFHPRSVSVR
ncbi:O-antigen ligase family protein [Sphingomonas fuzhouensis]|uniref:O-antigen ligase family protein n=1 Tax=Sphingomonas fuzhouensis TaxID=3106033 RepID=UPI002AFF3AA3|nr:O-antigen ligase family protein [Sphingomonas sp. SGZ-02]